MVELAEIKERDGPELIKLKPPVQRAAYSDRTAWQMAVLAELAYVEFETATPQLLNSLAEELAQASGVEDITKRLLAFRDLLKTPNAGGEDRLRKTLAAGGFELVGTFFNQSLNLFANTEGFVAKKIDGKGRDFAVLAVRGTTTPQDWIKNAKISLVDIGGNRKVHKGFHEAFKDAEDQIANHSKSVQGLPLFVTGHSLGGAVAVVATWYFKRDTLAACYTFGAPRVGNHVFNDAFHTPIYRVVNAVDPVPMVPPTNAIVSTLKFLLRLISRLLGGILVDPFINLLLKAQEYRHAGDLRHMTAGEMAPDGSYPTVKFYTQFGLGDRIGRILRMIRNGELKRLDIYHNMSTYRRKLRSRALERAPRAAPIAPSALPENESSQT